MVAGLPVCHLQLRKCIDEKSFVCLLHIPIKMQRTTERTVIGLLRTKLSRMTLNTGEEKQMTMRSPMGINGTAITMAKAIEALRNP